MSILSVECNLPAELCESIRFTAPRTFADSDAVIIDPQRIERLYPGKVQPDNLRHVGVQDSVNAINQIDRRKKEIGSLLHNGRMVISFLTPVQTFVVKPTQTSQINMTNYDWLPDDLIRQHLIVNLIGGEGNSVVSTDQKHLFSQYYRAFKDSVHYHAYLQQGREELDIFITNTQGQPVGFSVNYLKGVFVFIPRYSPESLENHKKFIGVIRRIINRYYSTTKRTRAPEWASSYDVPGAKEIEESIDQVKNEIRTLEESQESLIQKFQNLELFKGLLYEDGAALEMEVIKAFQLLGFAVQKYQDSDMEHDLILEADEGRAIGEVEGKEGKAINIDKLDQLTRVVDEDFHLNEEYAQGVLVGNTSRLLKLDARDDPFTKKVRKSAKRKGFCLLTTVELFETVLYVLANPNDEEFKKDCRKLLFDSQGEEIHFPIPLQEEQIEDDDNNNNIDGTDVQNGE